MPKLLEPNQLFPKLLLPKPEEPMPPKRWAWASEADAANIATTQTANRDRDMVRSWEWWAD